MHGHMYSDSLGAAAGCPPERSSLGEGVPSVGNAGFIGRVIQLAAVLRVTRVRLRRAVEHAVQRRVPAPRDLPEHLAMEVRPRPVCVPAARLRQRRHMISVLIIKGVRESTLSVGKSRSVLSEKKKKTHQKEKPKPQTFNHNHNLRSTHTQTFTVAHTRSSSK